MDIYTPIGAPSTPRPLLIMAHGGSFSAGDKTEHTSSEIARRFASRGYTTCSINYRLESSVANLIDSNVAAGAVIRAVADMKTAIRFFKNDAFHANLYNVDTTTIYVGGNSAGAITAVNLAYLNDTMEAVPYIRTVIRNNGGLEGDGDFQGYTCKVQGVLNFAGGVKDSLWISAGEPKIFSAHGDADRTVPYAYGMVLTSLSQGAFKTITLCGSGGMKPRLDELGITNQLKTYVGADHVPWESDTNKWNEIDTLSANFLGVQQCYKLGYVIAGINDISATTAVALYPNPASNMITIHADAVIENINVIDRLGRVINTYSVKAEEGKIDVSTLSTGIYIARINLKAGGNVVRTFTVE
jgi:acetyl esterase/lipase